MEFTIPGKPQGKARARTFYNSKLKRMQSITPENTVLYENLVKQMYNGPYYPEGALKLTITAYFEIPKSTTKRTREEMLNGTVKPTKKPDADNIAKVICDALNGVAYKDDTQITLLTVHKEYTNGEPCVLCNLEEDL